MDIAQLDVAALNKKHTALHILSPRKVYHTIKQFEREMLANDSTYWLVFELLWRDFFRFVAMKYGNRIFEPGAIRGKAPPTSVAHNVRPSVWTRISAT